MEATERVVVFTVNGPIEKPVEYKLVVKRVGATFEEDTESGPHELTLLTLSAILSVTSISLALAFLLSRQAEMTNNGAAVENSYFFSGHFFILSVVAILGLGLMVLYWMKSQYPKTIVWARVFGYYVAVYIGLLVVVIVVSAAAAYSSNNGQYVPSPPPSVFPSPPPATPGSGYAGLVTVTTVVSGSVQSFDSDAYKLNMASLLPGVDASDITLNVTAGSVRVEASIITNGTVSASSVAGVVSSYSTATLSAALNVTIEQIVSVTSSTAMVSFLPKPPPLPPPTHPPPTPSEPPPPKLPPTPPPSASPLPPPSPLPPRSPPSTPPTSPVHSPPNSPPPPQPPLPPPPMNPPSPPNLPPPPLSAPSPPSSPAGQYSGYTCLEASMAPTEALPPSLQSSVPVNTVGNRDWYRCTLGMLSGNRCSSSSCPSGSLSKTFTSSEAQSTLSVNEWYDAGLNTCWYNNSGTDIQGAMSCGTDRCRQLCYDTFDSACVSYSFMYPASEEWTNTSIVTCYAFRSDCLKSDAPVMTYGDDGYQRLEVNALLGMNLTSYFCHQFNRRRSLKQRDVVAPHEVRSLSSFWPWLRGERKNADQVDDDMYLATTNELIELQSNFTYNGHNITPVLS